MGEANDICKSNCYIYECILVEYIIIDQKYKEMGNQYSLTSDVSKTWKKYDPNTYITVALAATIDTVHLVGKAAASQITPHLNNLPTTVYIDSTHQNQVATYVRVRATWLGDGSYSGVGSVITGTLTGMALTHWYLEIQTNLPNVWYWAELNTNAVRFRRCYSRQQVNKLGANSGNNSDAKNFSTKYQKRCYRKLNEIQTKVRFSNNVYSLQINNCQHWAKDLYDWI